MEESKEYSVLYLLGYTPKVYFWFNFDYGRITKIKKENNKLLFYWDYYWDYEWKEYSELPRNAKELANKIINKLKIQSKLNYEYTQKYLRYLFNLDY